MRFPSRRGPTARTPVATYAAIVGDRWLWVALPSTAAVTLLGDAGPVEVPVHLDDTQPGHHGTRLDLAALPDREAEQTFSVHVDGPTSGPLTGPEPKAQGRATTHALTTDDAGHLHVVRRAVGDGDAGTTVRALRIRGSTVEVDLDGPDSGDALVLVDGEGAPVATLPLESGTVVIGPDHLSCAGPGDLRALVRGRPVRRRANGLADPGGGALLPAVHVAGESEPRARLRWSPDGSLVVRVHDGSAP